MPQTESEHTPSTIEFVFKSGNYSANGITLHEMSINNSVLRVCLPDVDENAEKLFSLESDIGTDPESNRDKSTQIEDTVLKEDQNSASPKNKRKKINTSKSTADEDDTVPNLNFSDDFDFNEFLTIHPKRRRKQKLVINKCEPIEVKMTQSRRGRKKLQSSINPPKFSKVGRPRKTPAIQFKFNRRKRGAENFTGLVGVKNTVGKKIKKTNISKNTLQNVENKVETPIEKQNKMNIPTETYKPKKVRPETYCLCVPMFSNEPDKCVLNFSFAELVSAVRTMKLPPNWVVKYLINQSVIIFVCITSNTKPERSVTFSTRHNYFKTVVDSTSVILIGCPETVDRIEDIEILADIVHNIDSRDAVVQKL